MIRTGEILYRGRDFIFNRLYKPEESKEIAHLSYFEKHSEKDPYMLKFEINDSFGISKKQLDVLSSLQDNWDGFDSPAISSETLESALKLLKTLPYAPMVYPISGGALQFEYETSNKYLEFEIFKTNIKMYSETESRICEKSISLQEAREALNEFYFG